MVQNHLGNIVSLDPGLGGMRDAVKAIIFHEQAQSNQVYCF